LPNRLIEIINETTGESTQPPPRTPFYSLPPIGVGTWAVESTTGYIARLAKSHGIIVRDLIAAASGGKRRQNGEWILFSQKHGSALLNGVGRTANEWGTRLNALTGQPIIHRTSLGHLEHIFRNGKVLRYDRAWCSQCLDEMRQQGRVYERLIWSLRHATVCPKHGAYLSAMCPHCGNKGMRLLSNTQVPGYCVSCSNWLGETKKAKGAEPKRWGSWISLQMGHLVAAASSDQRACTAANVVENLHVLVRIICEGQHIMMRFAKAIDAPKSTCSTWLSGRTLPTLDYWLRIAWASGLDLDRLLFCSLAETDESFHYGEPRHDKPWEQRPTRPNRDWALAERRLTEICASGRFAEQSMTRIAADLGVGRETLKAHFPLLYGEIYARSTGERSAQESQQKEMRKKQVQDAVVALRNRGHAPTRRQVAQELGVAEVSFRRLEFQDAWRSCVGTATPETLPEIDMMGQRKSE